MPPNQELSPLNLKGGEKASFLSPCPHPLRSRREREPKAGDFGLFTSPSTLPFKL
jgi:hypothetical protein